MNEQEIRGMVADVKEGTLSRRSFMQRMAAVGIAESEGMMTEQGFEDAKNSAFMDLMETLNVCGVKVLPIIDGDFIEVGAD